MLDRDEMSVRTCSYCGTDNEFSNVGIPLTGLATICSIGKCGGLPKNLDGA